jgi:hypothetical protein
MLDPIQAETIPHVNGYFRFFALFSDSLLYCWSHSEAELNSGERVPEERRPGVQLPVRVRN